MSKDSGTAEVNRREFITGAGSVAAAGYLAVTPNSSLEPAPSIPTPTSTTRDITITVDNNGGLTYTSKPPQNPDDASTLYVNPGDSVRWRAVTSKPNHRLAVLFPSPPPDTPFVDRYGNPVVAFGGTAQDEDDGHGHSKIGMNATIGPCDGCDEFDYSVAIFDDDAQRTYVDYDPHIIIGTVNLKGELAIEKRIKAQVARALKTESVLKGELEAIEKNVNGLIQITKSK